MKTLILRILSAMPFGIISYAAKAALQDSSDFKSVTAIEKKLQLRRHLIMAPGTYNSSVQEAMDRFRKNWTGESANVETEFWKLIEEMEGKGLLQRHGEFLASATPSHY